MTSWRDNPIYQAAPAAAPPPEPPPVDDEHEKMMGLVRRLLAVVDASRAPDDDKHGAYSWLDRLRKATLAGTGKTWMLNHKTELRQALAQVGHAIVRDPDEPLDGPLLAATFATVFEGTYTVLPAKRAARLPAPTVKATDPTQGHMDV